MSDLVLERREQPDETAVFAGGMAAPMVNEDYWTYRVKLGDEGQAVLGFPKFTTIGIGFAQEEGSWNTNLPYTADAEDILAHILCNKGDAIPDQAALVAIQMIQAAAHADRER